MQHHYHSFLNKIGVLYLFAFIIFGSIQQLTAQSIEKDWKFSSITDSLGNNLFEINENDTFSLSEGAFSYNLKAKDSLKANGDYMYQNNLLVLFYNQPKDTIRRYRVTSLTESSLVFTENNINYAFTAPTQTELTEVVLDDNEKKSLALEPSQGLGFNLQSIMRGALGMVFLLFVC